MSIEPVVGPEEDPYSIREKDLPQIMEEYDKLALEYIKREKEGNGFNFFHFMIDLIRDHVYTKDCQDVAQEQSIWQLLLGGTFIRAISL